MHPIQPAIRAATAGALALVAAWSLSACSSGPSEADIAEAFDKAAGGGQIMGMKLMEYSAIKKIGCTATDGGHNCDVEFTVKAMGQQQTMVQRLRFVKGSQGWALAGPATS